MAYESFFYWSDWAGHCGVVDDAGAARFVDTGVIIVKSDTGHYKKSVAHYRALGVNYEEWDAAELARRCPIYDVSAFYPPKLPEDPAFHAPSERELEGAVFTPQAGYVSDPQLATHNIQRAAEAAGATFLFRSEVAEIRQIAGRVAGVTLRDGGRIDAPVVINVAGPHSGAVNRMAGVEDDMGVRTRPLRHEVHIVPAPWV